MNLTKLFETQKALDDKIYDRFPGLKEEDWSWKITALLTELGECANEHRGFKKWSENQRPRTEIYVDCIVCDGTGDENYEMVQEEAEGSGGHEYIDCESCEASGSVGPKNPLLEEFVDCVHFFISIALELKMFPNDLQVYENYTESTVERTFNKVFYEVLSIDVLRDRDIPERDTQEDLQETLYLAFSAFVGIGEQFFDFTWDQIEAAYFEKNKINHSRQENNY